MLGYLVEPFIQIQNGNGTPISGARIYVYNADTTDLSTTYNDFDGHYNTNPVITDELGNATIIADDGIEYDIAVYDENGLLLFTKKHVSIDKTSSTGGNTQIAPGYGITVTRVGNTFTVAVDTDLIATQDDLADKQDKLTPGDNISITDDNVINVVRRRELSTAYPLRLNRLNSALRLYIDDDYYKTKQSPVEYGGSVGNYISAVTQNENGEISATVGNLQAGANISFASTDDALTISSKDWSADISTAVSTKLDTSTFNTYVNSHANDDVTPYTAGSNITIANHIISGKDWSTDISNAPNTYSWDVSPYTAGTGISVSNHTISCTGDITAYTAGTGISISGHQISCTGDITPYTAGTGISISGHQISCTGDITPYTAGTGISISDHTVTNKDAIEKYGYEIYSGSYKEYSWAPYGGDTFRIRITKPAGSASGALITVYNDNTADRSVFYEVQSIEFSNSTYTRSCGSISKQSNAAVFTVPADAHPYKVDLELVFPSANNDFPYCQFTIVITNIGTSSGPVSFTIYKKYVYHS